MIPENENFQNVRVHSATEMPIVHRAEVDTWRVAKTEERERERETDRQTDRQRQRERERETLITPKRGDSYNSRTPERPSLSDVSAEAIELETTINPVSWPTLAVCLQWYMQSANTAPLLLLHQGTVPNGSKADRHTS